MVPSLEQFAGFLARDYGLTGQAAGGLLRDALLGPVLAEFRAAGLVAAVAVVEAPAVDELTAPAPTYEEQPFSVGEPHPFFGESAGLRGLAESPVEAAPLPAAVVPAPTASVADGGPAPVSGCSFEQPVLSSAGGADGRDWVAGVTAWGGAAGRVPRQHPDEKPAEKDPIHRRVERIATWPAGAQDTSTKLSGAEAAQRLGVLPKTGQRRVLDARKYPEEQCLRQGRAYLSLCRQ